MSNQPSEEWYDERVKELSGWSRKIHAGLASYQEESSILYGTHLWLSDLVDEMIRVYQRLEQHHRILAQDGKRWRKLIGLDEDATGEEVERRLNEMREMLIETRNSWKAQKGESDSTKQ
ncbi:MAG: hypothetical protein OK456_10525 [Thaumarchaeota archaeon]|nr:hypothetical protein [Nitrososphaerota archaeon]